MRMTLTSYPCVAIQLLLLVIAAQSAVLPGWGTTGGLPVVQRFTTMASSENLRDATIRDDIVTYRDTTVEDDAVTSRDNTVNPIDDTDTTVRHSGDDVNFIATALNPTGDNDYTETHFEETTVESTTGIADVNTESREDILQEITTNHVAYDVDNITEAPLNFKMAQTEDEVISKNTKERVGSTKNVNNPKVVSATIEQVHTEDNKIPIIETGTISPISSYDTTVMSIHRSEKNNWNNDQVFGQPRIINFDAGMIFGHNINEEQENEDMYTKSNSRKSSKVNFGGPTKKEETYETHTKSNERKSSRVNFGGPVDEETTIENLNEIFTPQVNINENKKAQKCKKRNLLYSTQDKNCHTPTTTGPCNAHTHWFVAQDDTSVGVCRPHLCTREDTPFLYKGVCSNIHDKCGPGERLYNDKFGEGFCGCEEGFLYHSGKQTCYRENLQGPCSEGKQWVKKRGTWMDGMCRKRGCGRGRVLWNDGRCYKVEGGAAFKYCAGMVEGEVKQEEGEKERVLECYLEAGIRSIAPVFQGRKCRRGRMWNKYRKRCVRTYGRGR